MNLNIYDVPTERLEEKVMEDLVKNALYAVRSDNSELVYECLGYLNAGDGQRKEYARKITAEDIRQGRSWRDK